MLFHFLKRQSPQKIYIKRSGEKDYCRIDDIPEYVTRFLVILEDGEFYRHNGVDFCAIMKSVKHNLKYQNKVGASTITQQLCKNLYFTFESSYKRKILEMLLAAETEKKLTKDQIIELYLNTVYFDNGQYGITNAAEFYFHKKVKELTVNEAFFLLVLIPVVGIYNPLRVPEKFHEFRNKKTILHFDKEELTWEEVKEIIRHRADNLDEDLVQHDADETERYVRGPMYNERFGPGGTEFLAEIC